MDFISDTLKQKLLELSDLLSISDNFAKGDDRPKYGQFQFLKLSIDSRLKVLDRILPQKIEEKSEITYVIKRGDTLPPPQGAEGSNTETSTIQGS